MVRYTINLIKIKMLLFPMIWTSDRCQ